MKFLSTRIVVICIVYLTLMYTSVYAFTATTTVRDFNVQTYYTAPMEVNVTNIPGDGNVSGSEILSGMFGGGLIGFIIGLAAIIGIGLATAGIGVIPAVGVVVASTTIGGATGGLLVGWDEAGIIDIPLADALVAVDQFIGHVIGMFGYMISFTLVNPNAFTDNMGMPTSMLFIVYFMIMPIWVYFGIAIVDLAHKSIKAVRG